MSHEASGWLDDADRAPVSKSPSAMSEFRPLNDTPLLDHAAHCNSIRDTMLGGLGLFTLAQAGAALAGDQPSIAKATLNSDVEKLRRSWPRAPARTTAP